MKNNYIHSIFTILGLKRERRARLYHDLLSLSMKELAVAHKEIYNYYVVKR